jgi:hypothetical protein
LALGKLRLQFPSHRARVVLSVDTLDPPFKLLVCPTHRQYSPMFQLTVLINHLEPFGTGEIQVSKWENPNE